MARYWRWFASLSDPARAQVTAPLLNKLRALLLRPFARQLLCGGPSTINLTAVLDHGGLLLVRIPKGVLGEETTRLVGSLILAQTWQAATARAHRPQDERRDASIVIDECHNFLNLPYRIEDMLAEARGFRVGLTLAHQNLAQLPPELREGINTNARNKIMFSVSPDDATHLARHTLPELTAHDLAHLDAFHAAARLLHHGAETRAFTLTTRPLPTVRRAARAPVPGGSHRAGLDHAADPQRPGPVLRPPPSAADPTASPTDPGTIGRTPGDGRAEVGSYRPAPARRDRSPHTGSPSDATPDPGVDHPCRYLSGVPRRSDERPRTQPPPLPAGRAETARDGDVVAAASIPAATTRQRRSRQPRCFRSTPRAPQRRSSRCGSRGCAAAPRRGRCRAPSSASTCASPTPTWSRSPKPAPPLPVLLPIAHGGGVRRPAVANDRPPEISSRAGCPRRGSRASL